MKTNIDFNIKSWYKRLKNKWVSAWTDKPDSFVM